MTASRTRARRVWGLLLLTLLAVTAASAPSTAAATQAPEGQLVGEVQGEPTQQVATAAAVAGPGPIDPSEATTLDAGNEHTCWLQDGSTAYCWGRDNQEQLGNGPIAGDQPQPVPVHDVDLPSGHEWRSISSGTYHVCGLAVDGTAYCWGAGGSGRLGNSEATWPQPTPLPVDMTHLPDGTTWELISSGSSTTCGIAAGGEAHCWGRLPAGSNTVVPTAVDVSGLPPETTWATMSAGSASVCGVVGNGTAYCWGWDGNGRLGDGGDTGDHVPAPSPVDTSGLPAGTTWATLSTGSEHACGLTMQGAAYCWGRGANGRLGNGESSGDQASPVEVDTSSLPDGTRWASISVGGFHTCAVTTDGDAYCWGSDSFGQLGTGDTGGDQPTPVEVDMSALPAGTTWRTLGAGQGHTCGEASDASVYCWGWDNRGQLGDGSPTQDQPSPSRLDFDPGSLTPFMIVDRLTVVGSVGDPTNPTATVTLLDGDTPPEDLSISAATDNPAVLPAGNVTIVGAGTERTAMFDPVGAGTTTVTLSVSDPDGNESTTDILYRVSAQPPDPSGRYHGWISDASAALDVGDGYMLLGDDEVNTLFLHKQGESGPPVKTWSFTDYDTQLGSSEIDIEAVARTGDTIIWSTSHGNSRSGGAEERRRVLFATTITGEGAEVELEYAGRYGGGPGSKSEVADFNIRADLISWDHDDGHGLGADFLGFFDATRPGVLPNAPDGFNIEALEFAPDSTTAYLGLRGPTIDIGGKHHAVVVPVINIIEMTTRMPAVPPDPAEYGLAEFGDPILLDLDGRSIRALRRNDQGEYLISAGPSPQNETWALYVWDGDPGHGAVFNRLLPEPDFETGGVWESIVSVPYPVGEGAVVRLVADSGDTVFYGTGVNKQQPPPLQKSYSQEFSLYEPGPAPVVGARWETAPVLDGPDTPERGVVGDSALWVHPQNPNNSRVVATLGDGGLETYDVEGGVRQRIVTDGVDYGDVVVLYGVELAGRMVDLAVVSDRAVDGVAVFAVDDGGRLSVRTAESMPSGLFESGDADVLAAFTDSGSGEQFVFVASSIGTEVVQLRLDVAGAKTVTATEVRRMALPGDGIGGIVVDQVEQRLYVSVDQVGIVAVDAAPGGGGDHEVVYDAADGRFPGPLHGLALFPEVDGVSYLLATGPADDTIAVFDADGIYRGRFGSAFGDDQTTGTTAVAATGTSLGSRFPSGMVAVHDTIDDTDPAASNLKLVPWEHIADTLDLVTDGHT